MNTKPCVYCREQIPVADWEAHQQSHFENGAARREMMAVIQRVQRSEGSEADLLKVCAAAEVQVSLLPSY